MWVWGGGGGGGEGNVYVCMIHLYVKYSTLCHS